MLGGVVLASATTASSSKTTWWNSSGKYLGGTGVQHMAYKCNDIHHHGFNNSTSINTSVNINNPTESTTGHCIGGQDEWIPNDNNDKALPNTVNITIYDDVSTNPDPVGTQDTAGFVSFYEFKVPPNHSGNHPDRIEGEGGPFCNTKTFNVPENADQVRVQGASSPVFAMADCSFFPDITQSGSFATKGTITFNMST